MVGLEEDERMTRQRRASSKIDGTVAYFRWIEVALKESEREVSGYLVRTIRGRTSLSPLL